MKRIIILTFMLAVIVFSFSAAEPASQLKGKKTKNETAEPVNVESLNDRINALISLTSSQEKEIQRLSKLVETLETKLRDVTEQLTQTKQERDSLAKQVQLMNDRIRTIRTAISDIAITEGAVTNIPRVKAQPQVLPQSGQPAAQQQDRQGMIIPVPSDSDSRGTNAVSPSAAGVKPEDMTEQPVLPKTTPATVQGAGTYRDNENLHMSLARAAASTGQPVFIQQGQYSLTGEPVQGDRCSATVRVKQGDAIIREKRYNVCQQ